MQNFSGKAGLFRVRVEGEGPLAIADGVRELRLDDGAKATLEFPLLAKPGHDVAQVRVRVDGGDYAVDRRYDLPVRAAWPGVLRGRTQVLGKETPLVLDASLAAGLIPFQEKAHAPCHRRWPDPGNGAGAPAHQRLAAAAFCQCAARPVRLSLRLRRTDHQQGLCGTGDG